MKTVVLTVVCIWCGTIFGATRPVRLEYATLSASMYSVLADNEGPWGFEKDSYFNTLKITGYFKVFDWMVSAGVPYQLTLELFDIEQLSRYSASLSDFSVEVGRRIGRVTPKLMFKAPLGYPTKDDVAWTGSGNMRLGIGLGAKLGKIMDGRVTFSGEAVVVSTINDTTGYPRFGIGSFGGYAVLKTNFLFMNNFHPAIQAYCDFSRISYSDWSILPQRSITVAPLLSVSRQLGKRFSASIWGGYGVKFSSLQQGISSKVIIAGISIGRSF